MRVIMGATHGDKKPEQWTRTRDLDNHRWDWSWGPVQRLESCQRRAYQNKALSREGLFNDNEQCSCLSNTLNVAHLIDIYISLPSIYLQNYSHHHTASIRLSSQRQVFFPLFHHWLPIRDRQNNPAVSASLYSRPATETFRMPLISLLSSRWVFPSPTDRAQYFKCMFPPWSESSPTSKLKQVLGIRSLVSSLPIDQVSLSLSPLSS